MTELVEKFSVTVTLNHDQVDVSKVYLGDVDLKKELIDLWPTLIGLLAVRGQWRITGKGLTIEVTNLGLEEEAGAGDN
jgi:hypothetical protein